MRRIPSFLALRAFEAAARIGSFARASEELHLTPSAISHQVKALERHFGRPLFVRLSRQVDLTADGRHLLSSLTEAFDTIEAACAEVGRTPNGEVLALHCAPSFASKWLGPKLPSFLRAHPGIALRLSASAEPIDLTRHEEIDLVIVYGDAPSRRGIVAVPLGVETVTALAMPRLAADCDRADSSGLDGMPLIESVVNPVRWPDWCALNGLAVPPPGSRPSFDRGALAVSAAMQGLGVALESTRFAHEELEKGELVALGASRWRGVRRVLHHLCFRGAQRDLDKITAFRSWLLQAASDDQHPEPAN